MPFTVTVSWTVPLLCQNPLIFWQSPAVAFGCAPISTRPTTARETLLLIRRLKRYATFAFITLLFLHPAAEVIARKQRVRFFQCPVVLNSGQWKVHAAFAS